MGHRRGRGTHAPQKQDCCLDLGFNLTTPWLSPPGNGSRGMWYRPPAPQDGIGIVQSTGNLAD